MKLDTKVLFEKVKHELDKNLGKTLETHLSQASDMIYRTQLLDDLSKILGGHESAIVLNEVNYDLFTSIHFSLIGLYRNSFASLRSASELGLGFFYFTDYNFHFQKWKKGDFDLSWTLLSDSSNGVLSESYLSNSTKCEKSSQIISDYKETYRHCSEYVHGKYIYMHTVDNPKIIFNEDDFGSFCAHFVSLTDLILSIMILRFNTDVIKLQEDKYIYIREIAKKYSLNLPDYGK